MNPQDANEIVEALKKLQELYTQKPSEWLPVIAAIGGAFVGAIASIIPIGTVEYFKNRKEANQLEASMVVEIMSLVEIIETRGYLNDINKIIEKFDQDPTLESHTYTIGVDDSYSRIYQENCSRIGLVKFTTATKIVKFHQLIDAVVQDVKPGGAMSCGTNRASFVQALTIFNEALTIAHKLKK